ncbi:MAG: peptidase C11 [Lachnospiraceae bacterium]|nr:peptidase C11 [Lachnospiraceae bacterium]MBR4768617.1 peptidase C11 [Lachnospiraceae bacterium]
MPEKKSRQTTTPTGSGKVHRRGEGLGTGPVGTGARQEGTHASGSGVHKPTGTRPGASGPRPGMQGGPRPNNTGNGDRGFLTDLMTGQSSSSSGSSSGKKSGFSLKTILIIVAAVALLGGGSGLFSCLTGGNSGSQNQPGSIISNLIGQSTGNMGSVLSQLGISNLLGGSGLGSFLGGQTASSSGNYNSWLGKDNTGVLDTEVASGARDKYTTILGKGKDVNTIMVYMCGTDLESKYGMGSNDLAEMAKATIGENINLIVYTGGCKKWQTSGISNTDNMILQVKGGKISVLEKSDGNKKILSPDTLSGFIKYCKKQFPANRYDLILWDHGGGSVTGYGYDEKNASSGSMKLNQIAAALKDGGVKFDFVGFDACLMATAETALMLEPYADYMIASEEAEPGVGWYYTDWLTKLNANPSLDTPTLGKYICDDFVDACATSCRGQSTTLSVIDVAEFAATVPDKLKSFATATTKLITGKKYETVATARSSTREFARSSKIDQVDLVHFALNLDTAASKELADALLSAIKYNKTSSDMTNSYGVSIYFPYSSSKNVDSAISTYKAIGMDNAYSKCIKEFATMEVSGQVATGGTADYSNSLLGLLGGGSNESQSSSSNLIGSLLGSALGQSSASSSSGLGNVASLISGLTGGNLDFLTGRTLTNEEAADYIGSHMINPAKLNWKDGEKKDSLYIDLSKEEWALITDIQLSMYYDDGQGYIDLGMDNVFDFDDYGNLLAPDEAVWLTINGEIVAYYYDFMTSNGSEWTIQGHVPVLLDGERANLILVFDNETPKGRVAGAELVYGDEVEVTAKNLTGLTAGQKIDFVADYYSYRGEYLDSYMIGEGPITVTDAPLTVGSTKLDDGHGNAMYRLTDIYNQKYWTEAVLY